MYIALFGATGMIGHRILAEALHRGHRVTAVMRGGGASTTVEDPNLVSLPGDVLNPSSVAAVAAGQDVLVSAVGPGAGDPRQVVAAARALVQGVRLAPRVRLIVVGGAGSLEVAPGVQLVDTPDFPPAWKAVALAHREALAVYRASDVEWTYVSPPALIEPGERTGHYRTGTDQFLTDASGASRISAEDFALAIVDEVEQPKFARRRFTVAY